MNFFKRIFFKKPPEEERHQEAQYKFNQFVEQGDSLAVPDGFYMIKDTCITCGAPEAEAPDLIEHADDGVGECYFKKQPETEEEVSRAMNAVMVSCIDALRYGGKDEAILKRMYEMGLGHNCDYMPANSYAEVTRKIVTFYFNRSINELANIITTNFVNNPSYKVIDFLSDKTNRFSFTIGWQHSWHDVYLFVRTWKTVSSKSFSLMPVPKHKYLFEVTLRSCIKYYSTALLQPIFRGTKKK